MTDEEIRRIQQENGNSEMFLHQRGMFWNAYDGAAFALARVTECQLKKRKATNRYELGFSKSELPKVLMQMEEHGMKVTRDSRNLKLIRFSGGNTEPDDELLNSRKKRKTGPTKAEIKNTAGNTCGTAGHKPGRRDNELHSAFETGETTTGEMFNKT